MSFQFSIINNDMINHLKIIIMYDLIFIQVLVIYGIHCAKQLIVLTNLMFTTVL